MPSAPSDESNYPKCLGVHFFLGNAPQAMQFFDPLSSLLYILPSGRAAPPSQKYFSKLPQKYHMYQFRYQIAA